MEQGSIKVADFDGVFVIKMTGDVRLTLSLPFDDFIDGMLASEGFNSVIFDLSDAAAIDSTTLGLMAKISILAKNKLTSMPIVVSGSPSMKRLLVSMGFEDIFEIVDKLELPVTPLEAIPAAPIPSEDVMRKKVVEAHNYLIDLNEKNKDIFKELLESLNSHK